MAAFALLGAGLLGLHLRLRTTSRRASVIGLALAWIGVQLTLPFYGAETFALRAIGQEALTQGDATLIAIADSVRLGPGLAFIVVGLLLLAVGGLLFAIAIWRSGRLQRWSGVPLAAGLPLSLPQFETPEAVRIAHGLLVMAGCLLLAYALGRRDSERAALVQRRTSATNVRGVSPIATRYKTRPHRYVH
jgi:hypothetical protein